MAGATATDPKSKLSVRPTDNGVKEGDWYPEDQTPKMFFVDAQGKPYRDIRPLCDKQILKEEAHD